MGHAKEVKAQLEALKVSLSARAGTGGRLFGSVTAGEVQEAVKAAGGPDLDKRRIELPGHIKSTGQYQVQVRLHTDVTATFGLNVVPSK
jgi:large subunit ribosomal protein L9